MRRSFGFQQEQSYALQEETWHTESDYRVQLIHPPSPPQPPRHQMVMNNGRHAMQQDSWEGHFNKHQQGYRAGHQDKWGASAEPYGSNASCYSHASSGGHMMKPYHGKEPWRTAHVPSQSVSVQEMSNDYEQSTWDADNRQSGYGHGGYDDNYGCNKVHHQWSAKAFPL